MVLCNIKKSSFGSIVKYSLLSSDIYLKYIRRPLKWMLEARRTAGEKEKSQGG